MAFKFDTGKHGSINDNAAQDLPVGKFNYEVTGLSLVPVKADKTKKRKQICIELKHQGGKNYKQHLEIEPKALEAGAAKEKKEGEAMRAKIAADTFNALLAACNITGVVTIAKFKKAVGKIVGIETSSTEVGVGKNKKTYVNIRYIDTPFELDDTEEEEADDEEDYEDEEESEEEEAEEEDEEEDEEEEEEKPAPKPKRKAAKKAARKKKPDPEEEEDEADDDEEEDDDDW